jgi:DNA-binding transcriptional MerR regulator
VCQPALSWLELHPRVIRDHRQNVISADNRAYGQRLANYPQRHLDFARERSSAAKVVACSVAVLNRGASLPGVGCVELAEYRLDDLARVSGVSARNIRAYRERGLLDPPRRVGRSAYYDDYHLSQLKTINQLLRKGFNSAHIAEFFESMRQGADLADILGIQQAVLGLQSESSDQEETPTQPESTARPVVDIDPHCEEARRLVEHGLAELVDGRVVLTDRTMGDIVARGSDQLQYVRAILLIYESTRDAIDHLAASTVRAWEASVIAQVGENYIPNYEELAELTEFVQAYRDLADKIVADRLAEAMRRHMVNSVSDYTANLMLSGRWEREKR